MSYNFIIVGPDVNIFVFILLWFVGLLGFDFGLSLGLKSTGTESQATSSLNFSSAA